MEITQETVLKIASANRANPYVDVTPYELGFSHPSVSYTGFHPSAGEVLIYATPATAFKDKEQVVGYAGKSTGASVRVAKGLTMRKGQMGSKAIRDTVRQSSVGDLLITNKRILFVGKDDSFEFQVEKISAVKLIDRNSFVLHSGQKSKNILVDSALVAYAYGLINYVISQNAEGTDLCMAIEEEQRHITQEQKALCKTVRDECAKIKTPKQKENKGCMWSLAKFLWIVLAIAVVGSIAAIVAMTSSNKPSSAKNENQYTLNEILTLPDHPLVFGSYEETKAFYEEIEEVRVVDLQKYNSLQSDLDTITGDKTLLYFIKNSTHKDYTGRFQINLYDETVCTDITADRAAELMVSYVPDNFFEYYSKDSSFKYDNNGCTVYVYSCRLNEKGVEYCNGGHVEYPYYYSFRMIHFEEANQWKLESDFAAYGGKGLEWIQKFSDEWNVDFKDYALKE